MFTNKKKTLGTKRSSSKNGFLFGAAKESAVTVSGNGAKKYSSTGNSWVDQFGKLGEYKAPRSFDAIARDCSVLYAEDKELFVKFTVYMRMISRKTHIIGLNRKTQDAQSGAELKHESIMRMLWLAVNDSDLFWKNITVFLSAGSCKDIFVMLRTDLVYHGWDGRVLDWNKMGSLILSLLEDSNTVDLVKKYLPQIRAKSQLKTVEAEANCVIAKWLCNKLFGINSYRQYRKLKTSGTAHEWQQLISRQQFDRIDFKQIHGRALNLLVRSKFLKNQGLSNKYTGWVDKQDTVKYTGFAHEVLCELDFTNDTNICKTIDKQFMELVQKAKDGEQPCDLIVVRDTSGSMGSKASGTKYSSNAIAKSLAMYFSEFLDGVFKNHWIEFNDNAVMHQWRGSTPTQKWRNDRSEAYGSTNFQSVIDLFCKLKNDGVTESDFPSGILCISDGEFNPSELGKTNVETARRKLQRAGFSRDYVDNFKIVLWNIPNSFYGGRSGTKFETFGDVRNVFYMSGYSGSNVKFLMNGKVETAADLFYAAMDQQLLNLVEK